MAVGDEEECGMETDDQEDGAGASREPHGTDLFSGATGPTAAPRASRSSEPLAKRGSFSFERKIGHIKDLNELLKKTTGLDDPEVRS